MIIVTALQIRLDISNLNTLPLLGPREYFHLYHHRANNAYWRQGQKGPAIMLKHDVLHTGLYDRYCFLRCHPRWLAINCRLKTAQLSD